MSAAPRTSRTTAATRSACFLSTSRSSPKILMASSALTPSRSSSTFISMGWVRLARMPGMSPSSSRITSSMSSWVFALRHSDLGCNNTNTSALLMGSAWAPTSPRPIRVTTSRTSGILSSRRSTRSVDRVLSVSEMEGAMVSRTTTVPSLSLGVNSEPRRGNRNIPRPKNTTETATANPRLRMKNRTSGR